MEVKIQSISYLLEEKPSILVRSSSTVRRREHVKSVLLLDKVSLTLHPGSVNAVLGTGKKCIYLMDIIALRQQEGLLAGKILCDCQVRKTGFYKDIAIVNDIGIAHFGSLTIFDYLYYGGRLRVTHGVVECRERARLACRVTRLDGSLQLHQLSKTELRILSIAIEIVGNPTLIVLKDPIEGLDAAGALEVMKVLRTVAKRISMPTTIVYNIPSLSEDMLPLVDHYNIFLGHTLAYTCSLTDFPLSVRPEAAAVWSNISHLLREAKDKEPRDVFEPIIDVTAEGENESMQAFDRLFDAFDTLITAPTNTNSSNSNSNTTSTIRAERAKNSINNEEEKKELIIEHGKFKPGFYPQLSTTGVAGGQSVSEFCAVTRKLETGDSGNGGLPVRIPLPIYKEVWVLFTRSIQNHYRNSASLLWGLVRMVLAAVLLGCLVLREGDNLDASNLVTSPSTGLIDRHAYNVSGVLFAIIVLVVLATAFAVPYVHSTGQLIKAEVAAGLVSTASAWVALGTVDLIMYTAACWALAVLVYMLINIQGSLGHYCWLLLLVTYCGYSLAATCAVWFRSLRQAWTCFAFITATCLIFTGFLQRLGSLGGLWSFLASLSFTRWAYEGLSIVAFSDAPDRDNYLELFGFDNTSALYCSVWLVVWMLLLQVLVLVGLMPSMYHMRVASNMRQFATAAPESPLSSTPAGEDHDSGTGRKQSTLTDWQFSARMKERLDSLWETTKSLAHTHTPTKQQQHSRRRTSKQKKGTPVSKSTSLPRPPPLPSIAAREKAGYEPPPLPGGVEANCSTEAAAVAEEGEEEETTVQFGTMHSMFGAYMQIHRHEEEDHPVVDIGSSGSSPVKSPVKTAPEVKSLSPVQTESFSSRIRSKAALGPNRVELVPIKGASESGLQTPVQAPSLQSVGRLSAVSEEESGSLNPILRDREVNSSNINSNNSSSSINRTARRGQRQQRNITADALESQHPPPGINYSVGMGNIVRIPPQMATTLSFSRLKHVQDGSLLSRAPTGAFLHGVSYQLAPGSCCCVVDGTGDGAAALLLQVLAGKTVTTGKTSGAIYVNKQRLDKDLQYLNAAYVQRGDVGQDLQHLTVRQILRYAAYLRRTDHLAVSSLELLRSYLRQDSASGAAPELMYEGASVDSLIGKSFDLEHRLNEVLALLCLEDVADTPIGTDTLFEDDSFSITAALKLPPASRSLLNLAQSHRSGAVGFRSLSGSGEAVPGNNKLTAAERRCVAIGVELVNRPGLVLLDDPFAGLQWQDAEKVAAILRNLARGGRTVVCCTDKPCQRVLACMSELLLLSAGLLVYSGPADAAAKHFANIGFEKPTAQNELDFVLDIAADRGKMKLIGGKRSNTLSPEDLADLNRSLVNIKAGRKKEEDAFEDAEHVQDQLLTPGSKPQMGNLGTALPQRTALQRSVEPQTWDTAVILAARGLHSIFLNKTLVFRHCLQCLTAGLLLGSVWWDIDGGNYQSRISLFATSYLAINLIVVDTIEGIFQRKETFQREMVVGVSTYKAHFLADCVGAYLLSLLGALLYTLPLYTMAGLRAGFGHYLYFLVATVLGVYANISLAYLLTRLCEARLTCKLLYAGAMLPLQLLLSGYPILLRTMPLWLSWGSSLCPMYYYLCGTFRNELLHNSHALGTGVSYHQLQQQYAYSYDLTTCIVLLLVLGFCCKGCWLATLRVSDLYHRQPMQQRLYGIRRKTRRLLQASLRWRDADSCTYYANTTSTATDHINYNSANRNNNSSSRVMEEEEFSEVDFGNDFHFQT